LRINVQQPEAWKADSANLQTFGRKDVEVKKQKKRPGRDIEKSYSKGQFVAKLRRLADCIEQNKLFKFRWQEKKFGYRCKFRRKRRLIETGF
jgi:hypothetical protein